MFDHGHLLPVLAAYLYTSRSTSVHVKFCLNTVTEHLQSHSNLRTHGHWPVFKVQTCKLVLQFKYMIQTCLDCFFHIFINSGAYLAILSSIYRLHTPISSLCFMKQSALLLPRAQATLRVSASFNMSTQLCIPFFNDHITHAKNCTILLINQVNSHQSCFVVIILTWTDHATHFMIESSQMNAANRPGTSRVGQRLILCCNASLCQ